MSECVPISETSFLNQPGNRLITVVGAGGKTSLIHRLATRTLSPAQRVVITSTTKIFPLHDTPTVLQDDGPSLTDRVRNALDRHSRVAVARRFDQATGKLIGIDANTVDRLFQADVADTILVEADGAARKPLKAPNETEPVIPKLTDLCIAVMGLDAVGSHLSESTVHRHHIFSRLTGLAPGEEIRPDHMIRAAIAPNGLFKGCPPDCELAVLLNKADIPEGEHLLMLFRERLRRKTPAVDMTWLAGSTREDWLQFMTPRPHQAHETHAGQLAINHQF